MRWSKVYVIGLPAIDSQHRRLFDIVSELDEALRTGLRPAAVKALLVSLQQYKTRHFHLEEKYMAESGYPSLEEQREAHAFFSAWLDDQVAEFTDNGLSPGLVNRIRIDLGQWLRDHVTRLDMEFGRYYRDRPQLRQP